MVPHEQGGGDAVRGAGSASGWPTRSRPARSSVGPSWTDVGGAERAEIGWAFRGEVWGRGYATEIGHAGLDYAFSDLGVDEVVSFTEVHNVRSRTVMERLGMRYVGRILRPGWIAGSAVVHEEAPFALYRITRFAHDVSRPWSLRPGANRC